MTHDERTPAGRLVDATTEAVDAATVLLLRDAPDRAGQRPRLEVLLLERHLDSDFAGGALVFPGGKVDPADRTFDAGRWTGEPLSRWAERLGVDDPADALGLLVAGVRETFEEAGVLLARREDGTALTDEDLATPSFVRARQRLAGRDAAGGFEAWLSDEELVLDLGALALWSWWVTPEGQHKRFDTRFLVAVLPEGQHAQHDDVETTSLRWATPAEALAAHERGEATVIFPTRRNLSDLARFDDAAAAWAAARDGQVDQRRIQPRVVRVGDRVMVQHPDEDDPEPI